MDSKRTGVHAAVVVAAISLGVAGAAVAETVASRWPDVDVRVDGVNDEWRETVALDETIRVAATNDRQVLYLAIITSDQQRRRQFPATGLIVRRGHELDKVLRAVDKSLKLVTT